jgi:predicted aconitase
MADTESLGLAGVEWLERLARLPAEQRRVRVPTITDPRGTDFAAAHRLKHQPWMLELERRTIAAFEALDILMTNTCINYQTIMPPVLGEHVAYGDTGVVIYCNSMCLGSTSLRSSERNNETGMLSNDAIKRETHPILAPAPSAAR